MTPDVSQVAIVLKPSRDSEPSSSGLVMGFGAAQERKARLTQVLREQYRLVWRTLKGLGVWPGNVDDAAQQVFLTFAARLDDIALGKERPFLVQVAVRVAANARRAQRRQPFETEEHHLASASATTDPEALLGAKQDRQRLQEILLSMPEEQRCVFILYELEGLTAAEISAALAVPGGTVASRLRRARARFRLAVGEDDETAGGRP